MISAKVKEDANFAKFRKGSLANRNFTRLLLVKLYAEMKKEDLSRNVITEKKKVALYVLLIKVIFVQAMLELYQFVKLFVVMV